MTQLESRPVIAGCRSFEADEILWFNSLVDRGLFNVLATVSQIYLRDLRRWDSWVDVLKIKTGLKAALKRALVIQREA